MSKELNEALRVWAAEQGAAHFAHFKVGDYLAHGRRGGFARELGRIEGFTLELRSKALGGPAIVRPGEGMRVEPALLIRLAMRRSGGMLWSSACQYVGERALAQEWRPADPAMVCDVLRQINGPAERRALPYIDPELSPENGR